MTFIITADPLGAVSDKLNRLKDDVLFCVTTCSGFDARYAITMKERINHLTHLIRLYLLSNLEHYLVP